MCTHAYILAASYFFISFLTYYLLRGAFRARVPFMCKCFWIIHVDDETQAAQACSVLWPIALLRFLFVLFKEKTSGLHEKIVDWIAGFFTEKTEVDEIPSEKPKPSTHKPDTF